MVIKKSNIFSFILGAIIFSGITSVVAYSILASDIGYTPRDKIWEVDNVKDAVDELYTKANKSDLIWINESTNPVEPIVINVDLSNYESVIVSGDYSVRSDFNGYVKIDVNSSGVLKTKYNPDDITTRNIVVNENSIEIKEGHDYKNNTSNNHAIPRYIFGIKKSQSN